jgi:hypothetical protein
MISYVPLKKNLLSNKIIERSLEENNDIVDIEPSL